jgi:hypothetical protein
MVCLDFSLWLVLGEDIVKNEKSIGAMHLTQVAPTYSISGHGRLPANIDGI